MKFKLYRQFGALNSPPIFDAIEQGLQINGQSIVNFDEDISVIWSVLWAGRMQSNYKIYQDCKKNNKPVLIIEVGNLIRNKTWRISLNNVNRQGFFGNENNLDFSRPKKLGLSLKSVNSHRNSEILLLGQHHKSLQWEKMPDPREWVEQQIKKIKLHTDRQIIFRPHPRNLIIPFTNKNINIETPKKLDNTYDDFDINYNYHCVINHNSGPAIQAAINGTPVICDSSSLAYEVSDKFENIENINLPDRELWFTKLCHTEWTIEEIAEGIPLRRLIPYIEQQLP